MKTTRNGVLRRLSPVLLALVIAAAFSGCGEPAESGARFTPIGEEREVHGTVTDAKLTVCGMTAGKPGTCEGALTIVPSGTAAAQPVTVEVTRDVVLKQNGETVFLPQLKQSQVTARYRATQEGPKVATYVVSP